MEQSRCFGESLFQTILIDAPHEGRAIAPSLTQFPVSVFKIKVWRLVGRFDRMLLASRVSPLLLLGILFGCM
jgi:hypothetical protein